MEPETSPDARGGLRAPVQRNWLQAKLLGGEYEPLPAAEVVGFLALKGLPFNGDALKVQFLWWVQPNSMPRRFQGSVIFFH